MPDIPSPHQSFIGPNNITFTTEGYGSGRNSDMLRVSSTYVPEDRESANRLRCTDLQQLLKSIFDGSPHEEHQQIPPHMREVLETFYTVHPQTGERILSIPASHIESWFNSSDTLYAIMLDRVPAVPTEISQQVQKAIGYLMSMGFPLKDLGLYGGLQSFVVHKGNQPLKDVDVTITGLEHVAAIKHLAQLNQRYATTEKQTRVKQVDMGIRIQRHQMTRIYIPDGSGLFCDIKVIRRPDDRLSLTRDVVCTHKPVGIEGIVVDALEALSTPMSFVIQDDSGKKMIISSNRYNYIGAVTEGMRLRVKAQSTTNPAHVLLLDQDQDTIEYLNV